MSSHPMLERVVKAYDIRGLVPQELDASLTYQIGAAFVRVLDAPRIVVGHDMRPTAPELVGAFMDGARDHGADVVSIGLCSTDGLYFASGHLNCPGAMFTASHNPAAYNGIKLCRAEAAPVSRDSGLSQIVAMIEAGLPAPAPSRGGLEQTDLLDAYVRHLHGLVDLSNLRPLRIVVDAGNGMAGLTAPAAFALPGLDIIPLYFELDGTFPNHEANPIDPENLRDLQAEVRRTQADLGLAFDGDADRCFAVDETGRAIDPSTLTALIAVRELARDPGAAVIYNLITSRSVPDVVAEHGGRPVRTRVGHSFIKQTMAQENAIFGGEHSGHFYFRDFWRADSGLLAALHLIAALGATPAGTTVSSLLTDFERWSRSGEINSTVSDQAGVMARVRQHYANAPGVMIDDLDGMTVAAEDWWFNLRPSNTEPLLRLNVEARDMSHVERIRDEVLTLVRRDS